MVGGVNHADVISTEHTPTSRQIFLAASPADMALMARLRADLQRQGVVVWTNDILLASGSSSAINRGLNQTNLVAAAVHGQIIELYVNLQRVAVVSNAVGSRTDTHGQIGVIVTPSGHQTEIIFQNAQVWSLWYNPINW